MTALAIPAPGFRTFAGSERPHLHTEAERAVKTLTAEGISVHPSEFALLNVLCGAVRSEHGQWYGSVERLATAAGWPWSRRWFVKWLPELEAHGLVLKIDTLPGRRLPTWQILPHLYLVSSPEDTSGDDRPSCPLCAHPFSQAADGPLCAHPFSLLVRTIASPLVRTPVLTEHRSTIEHRGGDREPTNEDLRPLAEAKAKLKTNGTNLKKLTEIILAEDRQELAEKWRADRAARATEACELCDPRGLRYFAADGTPTGPDDPLQASADRCAHIDEAAADA